MKNPFESIESRLAQIENLILDIKHHPEQKKSLPNEELPILIKEASTLLGLTVPTMYGKVNKNEIPYLKRGNRLYFFKSQLIEYIKEGQNKSDSSIKEEAEADNYLYNNKKGQNHGK
ncbi:helix-turn-helix domain-containing protein [Maribacter sp. MAR_2009_72]|uniref:helix-turn-helix domain-containing protein n=1 Tax=Maribacter sp. MAR_2009_72 TaxID=1250050 RepID=UPI001198E9C3|nr:helix-turn-helix domain-containing protein [Maribacter sp. MAR_2009_72]TVZ16407.1 AlpA family transcriptional regulator [Maribacter sp. MAR_2009_72]